MNALADFQGYDGDFAHYYVELRIVVTYVWDNVATGEFEVNSVNKDIVNKCSRIIVNSSIGLSITG